MVVMTFFCVGHDPCRKLHHCTCRHANLNPRHSISRVTVSVSSCTRAVPPQKFCRDRGKEEPKEGELTWHRRPQDPPSPAPPTSDKIDGSADLCPSPLWSPRLREKNLQP